MLEHIYYHIGIVARDYQEAAEHYSKVLDVKFTEPAGVLGISKIRKRSRRKP